MSNKKNYLIFCLYFLFILFIVGRSSYVFDGFLITLRYIKVAGGLHLKTIHRLAGAGVHEIVGISHCDTTPLLLIWTC